MPKLSTIILLLGIITLSISVELLASTNKNLLNNQQADQFVSIVFDDLTPTNQAILKSLEANFFKHTQGLKPIYINGRQFSQLEINQRINQNSSCALLIGSSITEKIVTSHAKVPLFAVNIPQSTLVKYHNIYKPLSVYISGIFGEQTQFRQAQLTKLLLPNTQSVIKFFNQSDKFFIDEQLAMTKPSNINLFFKILPANDSSDHYLKLYTKEAQALLLTNNQQLFSSNKLASLLVTATQLNIPIIGNTLQHLKLGAIASVYNEPNLLVAETLASLNSICLSKLRPKPRFANTFKVGINPQVAKVFSMPEINAENIYHSILMMEQTRNSNNDE